MTAVVEVINKKHVTGCVRMLQHTKYAAHYTRTITMRKHHMHTLQVRSAAVNFHTHSTFTPHCANHTAGFSGQKGGTRIPTRLMQKVESGGCSGRADGLVSCCVVMASCCIVITSGSPLWLDAFVHIQPQTY
jgi:hypothetical protein